MLFFCLIFLSGCGDDEIKLSLTIDGKGVISLNGTKYETSTTIDYEETEILTVVYDESTYDDWEFVTFSGALTGTSNSQTLTMNENKSLSATFQLKNSVVLAGYVFDVNKIGIQDVIVSSGTPGVNEVTATTSSTGYYHLKNVPVPSDKRVFLTFQAETFAQKTVYIYKEKAEISVEDIELLHEYQLTFENPYYSIGSSSPVPQTYTLAENETRTITAVFDDILLFDKWSGDVPSSEDATSVGISITMDKNRTIVAEFIALTTHSLQVFYNEQQGSVSQSPVGVNHVSDKAIQLYSTPETGYEFDHWLNHAGEIFNDTPLVITLDEDSSYTCIFTEKAYILTLTISGEGIVKQIPESNTYSPDAMVQLTAIPAQGWKFRSWQGIDSTARQLTVIMDSDKSIEAIFERPCASFSGQVTDKNGTGLSGVLIESGSKSTNSDNAGYFLLDKAEFSQEVSDITVSFQKQGYCLYTQEYQVQDQQLLNISPQLSENCQISVSLSGQGTINFTQNGIVIDPQNTNVSGQFTITAQSWETVKAMPVPETKDWIFSGWSDDLSGSTYPAQFVLQSDMKISAQFTSPPFAGKIDLLTLINTLNILTQQTADVFPVDIDNNNKINLVEVVLMMRYLSE